MTSFPILRVQQTIGTPLQASKWLKYPILIDGEEMEALFKTLGDFWIFLTSQMAKPGQGILPKETFLTLYHQYVDQLKAGINPDLPLFRAPFSSVLSVTGDALYAVQLSDSEQLIKICKPVIQMQPHHFDYSPLDGKFRSMVWGPQSLSWGIQFSYPQIYQDEKMQVRQIDESSDCPNTALFRLLQKWIRYHTIATPFLVDGRRVNVPIRLGKNCLKWINRHPQLSLRALKIVDGG